MNAKIEDKCSNRTQSIVSCYIRSLFEDAYQNRWQKYVMTSLLFTYASVYFHIIVESSRTNGSGLLSQTMILTMSLVIGLGVSFPILFIPAYIYFHQSQREIKKSPVIINTVYLALIYTILFIILPTYLYYFLASSNPTISLILAIILLASPIGFPLLTLPFRFCPRWIRSCWFISSHRLIVYCHIVVFILHSSLFFISLVSVCLHWSFDQIKISYIDPKDNVNPVGIIWSADYVSLLASLILFIIINEYFFHSTNYLLCSSRTKAIIAWFFFIPCFLVAPCLAFPLYLAWRERLYIDVT